MRVCNELKGMRGPVRGPRMAANQAAQSAEGRYGNHHQPKYSGAVEQLPSVCSHIGAITLPLPASVANVQRVFDADGRCLDAGTEKLGRGVATNLLDYLRRHVCPEIQLERILREGVAWRELHEFSVDSDGGL